MSRIGQRIAEGIESKARDGRLYFPRHTSRFQVRRHKKLPYSIWQLSKKLDITAEHTRRVVRGLAIPSYIQLRKICQELKIPYGEAAQLVALDRMQAVVKHEPLPQYPALQVVCMLWPRLSEAQQTQLMRLAHSMLPAEEPSGIHVVSKAMAAAG